jgi:hypothetical protein
VPIKKFQPLAYGGGAHIDSRPIDKWKYPVGAYP